MILVIEDLNNSIPLLSYDKDKKKFKLPPYLGLFCGELMQKVAEGKTHVILTVSDTSKSR